MSNGCPACDWTGWIFTTMRHKGKNYEAVKDCVCTPRAEEHKTPGYAGESKGTPGFLSNPQNSRKTTSTGFLVASPPEAYSSILKGLSKAYPDLNTEQLEEKAKQFFPQMSAEEYQRITRLEQDLEEPF